VPAIRRQRISLYEPDVDESKAGTQRHDDQRNGEHTTHQSATPQWMMVLATHHLGNPGLRPTALALLRRDDPAESDSPPVLSSMWNEPTGVARAFVVMEPCRQPAPGPFRLNLDSPRRPLSNGFRGLRNRYFSQKVHTLPSSAARHHNSLLPRIPASAKTTFRRNHRWSAASAGMWGGRGCVRWRRRSRLRGELEVVHLSDSKRLNGWHRDDCVGCGSRGPNGRKCHDRGRVLT
jgi:hypothetical protein